MVPATDLKRGLVVGLAVGRVRVGAGVGRFTVGARVGRRVVGVGNLQSVYRFFNVPPMTRHAAV